MATRALLFATVMLCLVSGCRPAAPETLQSNPPGPAAATTAAPDAGGSARPDSTVRSLLPSDLPTGFPLPQGELLGWTGGEVEEGSSFTFALKVGMSAPSALAWYRGGLEGAGYVAGGLLGDLGEGGGSFTFTKGGQAEQGLVTVERHRAGAVVSVTLTVEESR